MVASVKSSSHALGHWKRMNDLVSWLSSEESSCWDRRSWLKATEQKEKVKDLDTLLKTLLC